MMKKLIIIIAIVAIFVQGKAQEKWSLDKCIEYALENNIAIKQSQINSQYQGNQLEQSKNNRLPNLNASVSQGFGFGRSLTPDNSYLNTSSGNTSLGVSTSVTLWQGGILNNTIKQRNFDLQSGLEDLKKAKDDVILSVASGYLEVLFAKELLKVAETQVEQTQKQIDRTTQLVEAGKLAQGVLLEIESQLAREELAIVNRENNLQLAYLNLAQFLELEEYSNFDIDVPVFPELKAQAAIISAKGVYSNAVQVRPEIKSMEYKLKSSETQLKIAEGNRLPSLSASAGIYDQYYRPFNSPGDVTSFGDQLNQNLRENISLNLRIPIFNRFQTRNGINNSKLQIENQELELEKVKKSLRKQIEQVYTNASAALKRYNANKVAVKSMQESFRYIEEKYNVGRVNSVEYNDAKSKLAIAESDLIQAKYDFIFRSKILDFYNGVPIEL